MATGFPDSLGTDFYCEQDISDDWAYENDPVSAYVQACARRIEMLRLFYSQPPKTPADDSSEGEYGAGLFQFILDTGSTNDDIRGAIVDSLMRDERTQNVEVSFEAQRIRIHITPRNAADFRFTLAIDKVAGVIAEESA